MIPKQKRLAGLVTAAIVVLTGVVTVSGAYAATPPSTGLTTTQTAQVVVAAKKLGYTDAQAKAISKNRNQALSIPVSSETMHVVGAAPKVNALAAISGPYPIQCQNETVYRNELNVLHWKLWGFHLTKGWCYDHRTVTYAPQANVWGETTNTGSLTGWRYDGITDRGEFFVNPGNGGFMGHQSYAHGHFELCLLKVGCIQNIYPTVLVTGWFDGHYNLDAW